MSSGKRAMDFFAPANQKMAKRRVQSPLYVLGARVSRPTVHRRAPEWKLLKQTLKNVPSAAIVRVDSASPSSSLIAAFDMVRMWRSLLCLDWFCWAPTCRAPARLPRLARSECTM